MTARGYIYIYIREVTAQATRVQPRSSSREVGVAGERSRVWREYLCVCFNWRLRVKPVLCVLILFLNVTVFLMWIASRIFIHHLFFPLFDWGCFGNERE